jgi:hypothetical protein
VRWHDLLNRRPRESGGQGKHMKSWVPAATGMTKQNRLLPFAYSPPAMACRSLGVILIGIPVIAVIRFARITIIAFIKIAQSENLQGICS